MPTADTTLPGALKLLGDPTRLRILALLERAELSVGELSRALALAQSRVSNHLRLLRDADLLGERHAGTTTFLRPAAGAGAHGAARLWKVLREDLDDLPVHRADLSRLRSVLEARRRKDGDFFERVAGEWDKIAGAFANGQARLQLAAHLLPREFRVADLGCGTGYVAEALLPHCSHVICIDRSPAMLAEAKKRLARAPRPMAVEFRKGALDRLPLADGEVDGVVAGMVLHHLPAVDAAIAEMHRVLKPGGTAAVLELMPHREAWMRQQLGDRHLGLEPSDVLAAFQRTGFQGVVLEPIQDTYRPAREGGDPVNLALYIVRGRRPSA